MDCIVGILVSVAVSLIFYLNGMHSYVLPLYVSDFVHSRAGLISCAHLDELVAAATKANDI